MDLDYSGDNDTSTNLNVQFYEDGEQQDKTDDESMVENESTLSTPLLDRLVVKTTITSQSKRKKARVFHKEWLSDPSFVKWLDFVKHNPSLARCKACLKTFSVQNSGKFDVIKHMKRSTHLEAMKEFGKTQFITTTMIPTVELDKISVAEGSFVYHGVKHGHSYRSQECTIDLARTVFETSAVAKSMASARTKSRAIACNVLAPYFTQQLIDEVKAAGFYSLSFDASNKGTCKTYPFAVQYFSDIGVKRGRLFVCSQLSVHKYFLSFIVIYLGLVSFLEDPHETAIDIFNNAIDIIERTGLKDVVLTSLGADNTNVNYGAHHSVFKLFQDRLKLLKKGKFISILLQASNTSLLFS